MTTHLRRRPATRNALIALAVGVLLAGMVGVVYVARDHAQQALQARAFAVGGCVTLPESGIARAAVCSEDPSYTVGAVTAAGTDCPSPAYQRAAGPDADATTLCLVPNLVAEHCYRLSLPIGTLARSNCAAGSEPDDGVLVQVTQRLDVHDDSACPAGGGDHVWPYPAPARTYCTRTLL